MRNIAALTFIAFFIFLSCDRSTNVELEESFEIIKEVTPISVEGNIQMNLQRDRNENSFFTVTLNSGVTKEAWCVEWNEASVEGLQSDIQFYSTQGKKQWKELNYFMSIKDGLMEQDPDLTFREIQVVIWSLMKNPSFDVDKISQYKNISSDIYDNGQPKFNVQKVKDILGRVHSQIQSGNDIRSLLKYFVIFIKNKGQTIMMGAETAFAYGDSYATCFTDFANLKNNRWGWSNGGLGEGEYVFDLYAGAGRCNTSKGILVGKIIVKYLDGTTKVTYKITEVSEFTNEFYKLMATHLYVGNNPLPDKFGIYTVAPGLYGHTNTHDSVSEYTYTINDLSGDIYIVAHADVNGFSMEF